MSSSFQILNWQPSRWDSVPRQQAHHQAVPHHAAKRFVVIADEGNKQDFGRLSFMIFGPSRSGKTALIRFMIRCITCKQFDAATLNPCDGSCRVCCKGRKCGDWMALKPSMYT